MSQDVLPVYGWENRVLMDLAAGPLVHCYPGFMGSICERLVAQGLARREDAGLTEQPDWWPKRARKFQPSPQYCYSLTDLGRARLQDFLNKKDAQDV